MAKDNRIWLKNIKTGLVFPANPIMLKYPNPDLMRVSGPEEETPVRPIVVVDGVDTKKWIDPESKRGQLMKAGIPDGALDELESDSPSPIAAPVVTEAQIIAAIQNMSPALRQALLNAVPGEVPGESAQPTVIVDDEVVGDVTIPADVIEANKEASILDAISRLDPANSAHFTNAGVPDARVLTEMCGFTVSAKTRDEVYAKYQKG